MSARDAIGGVLVGLGIAALLFWPISTTTEAVVGGLVGGVFIAVGTFVLTFRPTG